MSYECLHLGRDDDEDDDDQDDIRSAIRQCQEVDPFSLFFLGPDLLLSGGKEVSMTTVGYSNDISR